MVGWLMTAPEPISPVQFSLYLPFLDIRYFLPLAVVCGLCTVATAIWAVTIGSHAGSRSKRA